MCYTSWDKGWEPVCGWSLMVLGLVVTCCEIKTDDKLKFIGTLLSKLLGKKLVCNFSMRTSLVFNSVVACFVFVVSHTLSWLLSGDNSSLLYGRNLERTWLVVDTSSQDWYVVLLLSCTASRQEEAVVWEAKVSELIMTSPRAMPSPGYQSETEAGPNKSQTLSENEGILPKYPTINVCWRSQCSACH